MDFGIFNLMGFRQLGRPSEDVIRESIEQTRIAEELGLGASWFAEHHFSNYAICPSPLMMVSACAPVTKTIKLATGVLVLPLYNPARLLSEIAFADAVCEGRLVLGLGSGYQPYEFERFQVDLADSKAMLAEFMDLIGSGLSQDFFNATGSHYAMPQTHIAPRPVQKLLPIWLAGDLPEVQRMAARRGCGAMIAGRTAGTRRIGWPARALRCDLRGRGHRRRPHATRDPAPSLYFKRSCSNRAFCGKLALSDPADDGPPPANRSDGRHDAAPRSLSRGTIAG